LVLEIECKVYIFIVAVPAILITGLFMRLRHKDSVFLKMLAIVSVLSTPLLLIHSIMNRSGGQQEISLWVGHYLIWSLDWWGLPQVANWAFSVFHSFTIINLVLGILLLTPFAIMGLGYRMLSLPAFCRKKHVVDGKPGLRLYLSMLTLLGIALFLFTRQTPKDIPYAYNNSVWFAVAGINAASPLAAAQTYSMLRSRRLYKRAISFIFVLLSLLVSTQFLYLSSLSSYPPTPNNVLVNPDQYKGLVYLQSNSAPTDVVIVNSTWSNIDQSLYTTTFITAIAGRPTVLGWGPAVQFANKSEIDSRVRDIEYFYKNPNNSSHIIHKYRISFVWVERGPNSDIDVVLQNFGHDFIIFYRGRDFAILEIRGTNGSCHN
jgi:hypothetical protein